MMRKKDYKKRKRVIFIVLMLGIFSFIPFNAHSEMPSDSNIILTQTTEDVAVIDEIVGRIPVTMWVDILKEAMEVAEEAFQIQEEDPEDLLERTLHPDLFDRIMRESVIEVTWDLTYLLERVMAETYGVLDEEIIEDHRERLRIDLMRMEDHFRDPDHFFIFLDYFYEKSADILIDMLEEVDEGETNEIVSDVVEGILDEEVVEEYIEGVIEDLIVVDQELPVVDVIEEVLVVELAEDAIQVQDVVEVAADVIEEEMVIVEGILEEEVVEEYIEEVIEDLIVVDQELPVVDMIEEVMVVELAEDVVQIQDVVEVTPDVVEEEMVIVEGILEEEVVEEYIEEVIEDLIVVDQELPVVDMLEEVMVVDVAEEAVQIQTVDTNVVEVAALPTEVTGLPTGIPDNIFYLGWWEAFPNVVTIGAPPVRLLNLFTHVPTVESPWVMMWTWGSALYGSYAAGKMETKVAIITADNLLWKYSYILENTGALPIHRWSVPGAFDMIGTLSQGDRWEYNIVSPYHPMEVTASVAYDHQFSGPSMAPIPEPGTILLLGSGLIGMAALGRMRRRKI